MHNTSQKSRQMIQDDLEESQILNQRFLQLLNSKNSQQPSSRNHEFDYELPEEEQEKIKTRFEHISEGRGSISYAEFRDSLGLLGREDSFISRIFHLIDSDGEGQISQQNYLNYIRTIIHGSEFDKQHFGWRIFSGCRDQLTFKDLVLLFEQISIVWNALTGEIVQPKKKYIEQLFNILDVDQDDVVTFQDYRVFYRVQPIIFGWFQYLNNIDISEKVAQAEMKKTKTLLQHNTLSLTGSAKTAEEISTLMETQQRIIDLKMNHLFKDIQTGIEIGYEKTAYSEIIKNSTQIQASKHLPSVGVTSIQRDSSLASMNFLGRYFDEESSFTNSSFLDDHDQEMSRLKRRKHKMHVQQNKDINNQMIKCLQGIMDKCYKAMNACSEYRELKQLSSRYSPSKLRLKEAKMMAINNKSQDEEEEKAKKKKKNVQVYFGHPNWNLVLNLMVGLRKSIRELYDPHSYLQLKSSHFSEEHAFLLGSKALKGKDKQTYKFIQMAPVVFQKLRVSYGINKLQYQKSVGPQTLLTSLLMGNLTALNQKCSTGKSGSFFYLTLDSKIFLKTIPKHEFLFFVEILHHYYKHQRDFPNTMIVRMYGLYKLKIYKNKEKVNTIYFISMENIFKDQINDPKKSIKIKAVYDLKGSLYGRSGQDGKELKDNDWIERNMKIHLPAPIKEIYKNQIKLDSKFFKHNNINDYSLMVSIGEMELDSWQKQKAKVENSKNVFKSCLGGVLGQKPGEFYILSIIDILTVFEMKKKFQYAFKSTFLSKDVSCIPPAEYCKRFRQFMWAAVEEDSYPKIQVQSQ